LAASYRSSFADNLFYLLSVPPGFPGSTVFKPEKPGGFARERKRKMRVKKNDFERRSV
jgi:hypothetical protein